MTLDEFLSEWKSDSPLIEVQTSGSTGTPKKMAVEKSRMEASARLTCHFLGIKESDSALLCMPLDYIAGKMMVVRAITCGLELVSVTPSSHPLKGLNDSPSFAAMVPLQVYNSLTDHDEERLLRGISHLLIGGGPVDASLEAALRDFPNAVWSTYGMTETLSHIALRRINGKEASPWYTPLDGVRVSTADNGCLVIDAPLVCDRPLLTNDIAELHADGHRFRIIGRKDNTICSGGIKIQAEEVERLLKPHLDMPFIITKSPDKILGETVAIVFQGSQDSSPALDDICRKVLPRHWHPRRFIATSHLPMTETGKPARARAEAMAKETNIITDMENNQLNYDTLRLPAEWEKQKAVLLTWPHAETDWAPTLDDITHTYLEIAAEIAKREKLIVVTPHKEATLQLIKEWFDSHGLDDKAKGNLRVVKIDSDDTWARDHGFITLTGDGQTALLDFRFNGWGNKFEADKDNAINRQLHSKGIIRGTYFDYNDFVLEGGSIESDGYGTVFTTTHCLLAPGRNQPMTQDDIEQTLKRRLNAKRIVWIDYGNLIGDDTDGHIDTLVRIAPADTLLYVGCDDEQDPQYADLSKMEEQLRTLKTKSGRGYRLLRLPMPRPIFNGDERLPATYANFLVINDAVLYPTYGQPDLDDEASQTIADAFPDREIIGIDCRSVIVQHGSLHCCTMQFPKETKKG